MRRTRNVSLAVSVCVAMALATAACSSDGEEQAASARPQPVETTTVELEPIPDRYTLSGTLEAVEEAVVSFELDGRVAETIAEEGVAVEAGDALATLDASAYELQAKRAEAALRQAEAMVRQAEAAVSSAEAGVRSAEESRSMASTNALQLAQAAFDKAQEDVKDSQALFDAGFLSESELMNARLALTEATTNLNNAKAQREQSDAGVASAQGALGQAQEGKRRAEAAHAEAVVATEQAALALSKTTLASPIGGVVLEAFVAEGQTVGAGQPAFRIGRLDRLRLVLSVPDRDVRDWAVGQQVEAELYGDTRTGTVTSVFPTTNAGSGSVDVEVEIDNPDRDWLPGQVATASRSGSGREALLVPVEAVVSTGGEPYVYRNVDGVAVRTAVTLGELADNRYVIVSGLDAGDEIVTKGAGKLFDGTPLRPAEGKAP